MSNPDWKLLLVAVENARSALMDGPLDDEEGCVEAALANLAPFFTPTVHFSAPVGECHVAEDHPTRGVFKPLDGPSCWAYQFDLVKPPKGNFELTLKDLDPEATYDLELRVRIRLPWTVGP